MEAERKHNMSNFAIRTEDFNRPVKALSYDIR
jgi:hypothetical protein